MADAADTEYLVDLHTATLFVPSTRGPAVGTVVRIRLESREGVALSALARVVRVQERATTDRPAGMELRLLEVRRATPLASTAAAVTLRPPSLRPSLLPGPIWVLVVDDDPVLRARAAGVIRSGGYNVLEASNGAQAIGLAVKEQVSLILTDVNMPVMDGWQLLRMVRARDELKHLAVIFLTSLTSDAERFRGYTLGVDDYIDKPYEPQALLARVEGALARQLEPEGERPALHGDLARVGLPNLLSLLELERRTGRLELRTDDVAGRVLLHEGSVVDLEIDHALAPEEPMDRFFAMLGWKEGQFDLFHEAVDAESDISVSISQTLLELARIEDEEGAEPA